MTGSLATGLYWHAGEPGLALADPDGADPDSGEHWLPLRPGAAVGWQLAGLRRCTGIWLADSRRRRFCPRRAEVPGPGGAAQCAACAAADPGRLLARDQTLDRRAFGVYLAWFGPELVKVGITAADRGIDRLAEQGALAFTWLAHARAGPTQPPVRPNRPPPVEERVSHASSIWSRARYRGSA